MPRYDNKLDGELMLWQALATGSPDGLIEQSEARGQQALVNSEDLPLELLGTTWKEVCEHTGIELIAPVNDLFQTVKLPGGWSKKPTDHNMWSELVDEKDRVRGMIFYKAAFYDRSAHLSFDRFYRVDRQYDDDEGAIVSIKNANGETLKEYGREQKYGEFADLAHVWLKENFPDWESPWAYWSSE